MIVDVRGVSWLCVALVAVAGCSSTGHPKPTSSLPSSAAREVYLSSVTGLLPDSYSDDDAVNLAKAMCAWLSSGNGYAGLVANQTSAGRVSGETAAKLIVAAVVSFCPDNLQLLPGGTSYGG